MTPTSTPPPERARERRRPPQARRLGRGQGQCCVQPAPLTAGGTGCSANDLGAAKSVGEGGAYAHAAEPADDLVGTPDYRPGPPGWLSALSVFLCKSVFCGAFCTGAQGA